MPAGLKLEDLIAEYEALGKYPEEYYEARRQLELQKTGGLDFDKTVMAIHQAAKEQRFISYKEVADASGVPWGSARRPMNRHLGRLLGWCDKKGYPLLSAIVVDKQHLPNGEMLPGTLKGFITGVQMHTRQAVSHDHEQYLRQKQAEVFAWAKKHVSV
jgi:hypothetical protein